MESPFEILGVTPDADDAAITQAYRERVKEAHPDQGGSIREFQRVRSAYEEIRTGHGPAVSETADGDDAVSVDEDESKEAPTVEYLDYEVLDDRGWALDDEDLFEKASDGELDERDFGQFTVEAGDTLLEAAEQHGLVWPYACRGGACANCAVAVLDGDLEPAVDDILSDALVDRGIRLSCLSGPSTSELRVVFNVKHLPDLDDLRLPADRFERAHPTDD